MFQLPDFYQQLSVFIGLMLTQFRIFHCLLQKNHQFFERMLTHQNLSGNTACNNKTVDKISSEILVVFS